MAWAAGLAMLCYDRTQWVWPLNIWLRVYIWLPAIKWFRIGSNTIAGQLHKVATGAGSVLISFVWHPVHLYYK